jgi:hypothetical protein
MQLVDVHTIKQQRTVSQHKHESTETMSAPTMAIAYGVPMAPPAERPQLLAGRSSRVLLPRQASQPLDRSALAALTEQGYTKGLAQALTVNKLAFALSIWIVDNSGSMQARDGHKILQQNKRSQGDLKFVECTRWAEMQQTVDYHVQMAAVLKAPTVFRMLNDPGRQAGPQQFSIAEHGADSDIDQELAAALSVMSNSQPGGVTPLTSHLREIRHNIAQLEPELRQNGTKVAIVLATDGLPTDSQGNSNAMVKQQFVEALRSLGDLPVWVVVRLCTDQDDVVEFWNSLDSQLELRLDILDDFISEAKEVHDCNKWLNYGLPLHRMREMGFHHNIFDLLDERKLSKDELRDFCKILFGSGLMDEAADPEGDWKGFCETISRLLAAEKKQWNPITKRMEPWIDMKRLNKEYGHGGWFW